jgi:hypothetical protein
MAIVVKFAVEGMSADKYDTALRRLEGAGVAAPAGRLHHVTYGSRDNLQVIDVFDSPQSLEAFGRILQPILQELGIATQADVQEVYKIISG